MTENYKPTKIQRRMLKKISISWI